MPKLLKTPAKPKLLKSKTKKIKKSPEKIDEK